MMSVDLKENMQKQMAYNCCEHIDKMEKKHNIKFIGLEFDGIVFQSPVIIKEKIAKKAVVEMMMSYMDDEYNKCAVCDCLCDDKYQADIKGENEPVCKRCYKNLENCEMCGLPTNAEGWYDGESDIIYCLICYVRNEKIIVGKYGNIKKSEN
jgi:hypothetical protein